MFKEAKYSIFSAKFRMFLIIGSMWVSMISLTACLDEDANQKVKIISRNQGVDGSLYVPTSKDQEESQGYGYGSGSGSGSGSGYEQQSSGLSTSDPSIPINLDASHFEDQLAPDQWLADD